MGWVDLFTSLNGRVSRKPFWIVFSTLLTLEILTLWLVVPDYLADKEFAPFDRIFLLGALISFCFLWASLPITIKRLHDIDESGWWFAVWNSPFVLSSLIEAVSGTASTATKVSYVFSVVFFIAMLIALGFRRGTHGPNRFGPDPLDGGISSGSVVEPA